MNIALQLPAPLNLFVIDVPKNKYYDFELEPSSTYPLKGVIYPVDYGNVPGYTAEDGHELDLFVGSKEDGLQGYIIVNRGEHIPNEHKFYAGLSRHELDAVLSQLELVLIKNESISDIEELISIIKVYKD